MRMRNFTLATFAALLAAQTVNAQTAATAKKFFHPSADRIKTQMEKDFNKRVRAPQRAEASIWRPAKTQIFYQNDDRTGWSAEAADEYSYTYDENGYVKTRTHYNKNAEDSKQKYERYTYSYDSDGRTVEVLLDYSPDGKKWRENTRTQYTWDDVVKTCQTGASQATYDKLTDDYTDFVYDNCFRREITRDEKGRVTSSVTYRYKQDGTEYVYNRLTPTYADGKDYPTTMTYEDQVYNSGTDSYSLGETYRFENITWKECDNQFVLYSNYLMGSSRATSYDFWYQNYMYGTYTMEYGEKYPEYNVYYAWKGDYGYDKFTCTLLDDNGSYETSDYSWYDMNFDGKETDDEITQSRYRYWFDERGKDAGNEQWGCNYGEPLQLYYAHKKVYTYDDAYDYQTQLTDYSWDMFNPVDENGNVNYQPSQLTVYSDFGNVISTGINAAKPSDANAVEVARYGMDAAKLTVPTKGVNIVKYSDGSVRKEIVK